ncbi:MAG: type II toxin-antitoxin system RelE/ParE family toxin [Labilibaculum sp.]|nr:type II toxin-antitoxin system RelE/ParE family toxin [Labilibaculum sp.]
MTHQVVWEEDAIEDRVGIFEFLFENAGSGVADKVDSEIVSAVENISVFPFIGGAWRGMGREYSMGKLPYNIYYDLDEEKERVLILRILHNKRQSI